MTAIPKDGFTKAFGDEDIINLENWFGKKEE